MSTTTLPVKATVPDAAVRILEAIRPDLLLTMRLLDRESTAEAHLRLTMCVAALDDVLEELGA